MKAKNRIAKILPTAVSPLLLAGILSTAIGAETEVFNLGPPAKKESGFGDDSVVKVEPKKDKPLVLQLKDLPPHEFLKIEAVIDLNQIASNNLSSIRILGAAAGAAVGPDAEKTDLRPKLQISVDGADPVVDSSVGSQYGAALGGSFPDRAGDFLHPPGTGSAGGPIEVQDRAGKIRFKRLAGEEAEKLKEHRLTFIVPHTGAEAAIEFNWEQPKAGAGAVAGAVIIAGMAGQTSSPFSIKELKASVIDAPVELSEDRFTQCYKALGAGSPSEAMDALNDLVSAGRGVIPRLSEELLRPADPDLEEKFQKALKEMDDPNFAKRAEAAKTLSNMGAEVIPLARRTLAEKGAELSIEVAKTLKTLADQIEKGSGARADSSRANRLHRLLDTLGGDEAEQLKAALPEPTLVVDPTLQSALDGANARPGVIELEIGGAFDAAGGALRLKAGRAELKKAVPVEPRRIAPKDAEKEEEAPE